MHQDSNVENDLAMQRRHTISIATEATNAKISAQILRMQFSLLDI